MRKDHDSLPLLGISKWEGEDGCLAYAKAYMMVNDLTAVRIAYVRTGDFFYLLRDSDQFSTENYQGNSMEVMEYVHHTTPDVCEAAHILGLYPVYEDGW